VSVTTVKPGFVDTPMTAHIEKKGPLFASAEAVGKGIVRAVDKRRDVVYLPGFWRWIMAVIRAVPEGVFKRLSL
jgi:short-subunit dehydrogenase